MFHSQACNCRVEKEELQQKLQRISDQLDGLFYENKNLQDSLEYAKNKENKLMYLIFKLHRQGYPVNEIYEQEVKPISTGRFNDELMQRGEDPTSNNKPADMLNLNPSSSNAHSNPGMDERYQMDMRGESFISFDS